MPDNPNRRIAAGPQTLGKVLSRSNFSRRGTVVGNLQRIFSAVLGHEIAENSAPYGVYDGELVIAVRSREVQKQLEVHQNFLCTTLQERCRIEPIKSVKFVIRPSLYPSATPPPVGSQVEVPVTLDRASSELVSELSAQVTDPDLRRMTEHWLKAVYGTRPAQESDSVRKDELN